MNIPWIAYKKPDQRQLVRFFVWQYATPGNHEEICQVSRLVNASFEMALPTLIIKRRQVKVNDLKGRQLDYWVAKADGGDKNTCRITLRAMTTMPYEKRGDYVTEIIAHERISLTPNHAGGETRPKGNSN